MSSPYSPPPQSHPSLSPLPFPPASHPHAPITSTSPLQVPPSLSAQPSLPPITFNPRSLSSRVPTSSPSPISSTFPLHGARRQIFGQSRFLRDAAWPSLRLILEGGGRRVEGSTSIQESSTTACGQRKAQSQAQRHHSRTLPQGGTGSALGGGWLGMELGIEVRAAVEEGRYER